jgi:hypothetical protein
MTGNVTVCFTVKSIERRENEKSEGPCPPALVQAQMMGTCFNGTQTLVEHVIVWSCWKTQHCPFPGRHEND